MTAWFGPNWFRPNWFGANWFGQAGAEAATHPSAGLPMSTRSWREIVESVDGEDRHKDSLYPIVYRMTGGREFRDSGPLHGIYED